MDEAGDQAKAAKVAEAVSATDAMAAAADVVVVGIVSASRAICSSR